MSRTILVVDDELSIRTTLSAALSDEGYLVESVPGGTEALAWLKGHRADVVLLDIWMPGMDGLEALKLIRVEHPDQIVLIMSGHGTIETAVKATKLGAYDFIEKPLSLERLLVLLQNCLSAADLARENQALRKQVQKSKILVGNSSQLQMIKELIRRAAPTTGSVLITGENGTGKELVAHSIHALSTRFNKPFIEVNCAAIPEELIESELFGHERGAFTGASQLRRGKFDLAHGGTLFLDEIGDMSLKTQAKILRILQEQKFERVGGQQTLTVDVRIVAATNKDLKQAIQRGQFREDLYYRLNVIPILMPPLRDRLEDLPVLCDHFLREFSQAHSRPLRGLSGAALDLLKTYSWPGNVRELKNLIERIIILTPQSQEGAEIEPADLFPYLHEDTVRVAQPADSSEDYALTTSQSSGKNLRDARSDFERDFIVKTLKDHEWNVARAAQILGIERTHLYRKLKTFGIELPTQD